jgi:hypothetical protein
MASERQIAANRRNAQKSTGPQTVGGKKRVGKNAYRHGLATRLLFGPELADQIEQRARAIAGTSESILTLACARAVAEAEFDVARVRQIKIALIERVASLGYLDWPEVYGGVRAALPHPTIGERTGKSGGSLNPVNSPEPMPLVETERSAEAIRRSLPELLRLDRYERRACSRRDRAVRELAAALARQRS